MPQRNVSSSTPLHAMSGPGPSRTPPIYHGSRPHTHSTHTDVTHVGTGWLRHSTSVVATNDHLYEYSDGSGPAGSAAPTRKTGGPREQGLTGLPKTGTFIMTLTGDHQERGPGLWMQERGNKSLTNVDQRIVDGTKRYLSHEGGSEDLVGILRPNRSEAEPNATSTHRGYDVEVKKDDGTIEKHRIVTHPGHNVLLTARNGEQARVLRLDTKRERALVTELVGGLQQQKGSRNAQLANDLRSSKGVQVTLRLEKGHLTSLDLHQLHSQGHGLFGGLFAR